ncbi:hypothetical protein COCSADRAFT_49884, partial [Bipolaris sorokiniana ND90Pr]
FYKTGDIAYFSTDGSLIIVGRKDNQVKLHGQRIELGEIEFQMRAVLGKSVTSVAVDVLGPATNNIQTSLVGFIENSSASVETDVQRNDGGRTDVNEDNQGKTMLYDIPPVRLEAIREALRAKLPSYMVPSTVWSLNTFPKLPSGKMDRKTLR